MKKQGEYKNIYKTKVIFTHTDMFPITYFLKESQCVSERNLSYFKNLLMCISALEKSSGVKVIFILAFLYTGKIYLTGNITAIFCCDFI